MGLKILPAKMRLCPSRTLLARVVTIAGLVTTLSISYAQDTEKAFGGATVALPPFYVEPQDGDDWILARGNRFELLTTHDRTFAREFWQSYWLQTHLVNQVVPERYRWHPHTPDTFVVVDRESSRLAENDAITQILEQNRENYREHNAHGRFLPNLRLISADSSVNFAFLNQTDLGRNGSRGLVFLPREDFAVPGVPQVTRGFRFSSNRLSQQLNSHAAARPLWAIAGLVDLYNRSELVRGRINVDRLHPSRDDPAHEPVTGAEIERLLTQPGPSITKDIEPWKNLARLFVQWVMLSEDGKYREAFWAFLDHAVVRSVTEDAFANFFKLSFEEAAVLVEDYDQQWAYRRVWFPLPSLPRRPALKIVPAKRADVVRILAEWERLEFHHIHTHYPELQENYLARARTTLASARQNHVDSAAIAAVAGLLEFEAGDIEVALLELTRAVEEGITRPTVLRALARIKINNLIDELPVETLPSDEQLASISTLLLQAHESSPTFPEIYLNLAELWELAGHPLSVADVGVLAKGIRSYPRNLPLVTHLAQMQARRGKTKTAANILKFAAERAADQSIQASLEQLITKVQEPLIEEPTQD